MKTLALVLLAAVLSPAFAANEPAKPKSRTLQEVIDLTMMSGKDATLPAAMAEKYGLDRVVFAEKKLRYKQSVSPDKQEHIFHVVLKPGDHGPEPIALEISCGTGKMIDGKPFFDGINILATLDGKLQRAFHNKGFAGQIHPEELSIGAKDVKQRFKNELDFYLERVPKLGLQPAS